MPAKHGTKTFLDKTSPGARDSNYIDMTQEMNAVLSRHANRMPNQFHHQHFHADPFSNLRIHESNKAAELAVTRTQDMFPLTMNRHSTLVSTFPTMHA